MRYIKHFRIYTIILHIEFEYFTYSEKFPPAISTIFPNSNIWQPLLKSSMLVPPLPLSQRHGLFLQTRVPFPSSLHVCFTRLLRTYSFPKYGKATEFLIKTVYPAALPINALPCKPMGSSSTSIGHQDSTSQVYTPSCFGLQNAKKNYFQTFIFIVTNYTVI